MHCCNHQHYCYDSILLFLPRFSLLLLEPGEIYFQDYTTYYYPSRLAPQEAYKKRQRGRLKLCSKSILFDPKDVAFPIIKIAFRDILAIDKWEVPIIAQYLRQDSCTFFLESEQVVNMKEDNSIKPYVFNRGYGVWQFSLAHSSTDDVLPFMHQLHRASTLPLGDQSAMINAIVLSRQSRVQFDRSWLEDLYESVVMETQAERVTPLVVNPGRLMLTSMRLYFQPFNNIGPLPVLKIKLSSIKRIIKRRFLLRHVGIEIFCHDSGVRKSNSHLYLAFPDTDTRNEVLDRILDQDVVTLEDLAQENMTLKWQNRAIGNFDYIMYLNTLADRSMNDLTQYPVFPWVLSNYTKEDLDLSDPLNFRDLAKPMGALDSDRLLKLLERYDEMPEPRFLYGSHYSTPGYVLFYLARIAPEYMLCLQNGKFDHPDRMFNSVADAWRNCLTSMSDFKELIPEFYDSEGEFLSKNPLIDFGNRLDAKPVAEVSLPPWSKTPQEFVSKMREALESDYVSENLHKWIDLIFGYKQTGEEAENSYNVFYHLTYEGAVDLEKVEDLNQRAALETQIMEFGQTPKQLFRHPHPRRIPPLTVPPEPYESHAASPPQREETPPPPPPPPVNPDRVYHSQLKIIHSNGPTSSSGSPDKLAVTDIKWGKNGDVVYISCRDGSIKKYSADALALLQSAFISSMPVSAFEILFDGRILIACCYDNSIYLYDMDYGKITQHVLAHDDAVSCIHLSSDLVATGSWDSTVKVWKLELGRSSDVGGTPPKRINCKLNAMWDFEHDASVTSVCISEKKKRLVTGDQAGTVSIWSLPDSHPILVLSVHAGVVYDMKLSPDEEKVLTCGMQNSIHICDLATGAQTLFLQIQFQLRCLEWNGTRMIAGTSNGTLVSWDLLQPKQLTSQAQPAHEGAITCVSVGPSGLVMSGGEYGHCVMWEGKHQEIPSE
ncbi:hypothetical protein CAPTEDRAFT_180999 [Capitella teleta]|uniref:BEACH domain-containing protein n=1 Tax=Capitella teleta TaxID=283909 RepID=R7TBT8_CAPTE|nr:hypothetical protein CAPTEDRAFT_180999 [Capitella teleta]|eukprot:ELT88952.1 hypothetical protein CAPTEDRAFT_180999 [Capitella teleta]